jgi:gamma-glutamyltranspeptidase / glutathione hydrolase
MEPPQHRGIVMAPNGLVAAGHPLASAAGLEALLAGGNAVDAALTMAAVMGVVQPMMSGLGGDTFLLYHDRTARRTWAINGSGPAPRALTLDYLAEHHGGRLPDRGMLSIGVPGAVDAMCTALERWGSGRFDLERVLAPAIRYAEEGAPVGQAVAARWAAQRDVLVSFDSSAVALLHAGRPYGAGEVFRWPELAASLRAVADGGREAFYRGALAERMARYCQAHDGVLDVADLAGYQCEVYEPIRTTYRGYTVCTTAPPSQGAILLEQLNLAEGFDLAALPWGTPRAIHLLVEAKKLAFADRNAYLGDPAFHPNPLDTLLTKPYAATRRAAIHEDLALDIVAPGELPEAVGDTTYLCAADRDGNLVSLITSLSNPFGCGEVVTGTGILLNNRVGRGFSTDPMHPNVLAPGKRTMHTLHCYLVFEDDEPYLVGGTPGGDAQPQWNLQVLTNLLDWGLNVQQAVEAPRWLCHPGTDPAALGAPFELRLEAGFPDETWTGLELLGHRLRLQRDFEASGAQLILVDRARGAYHGASDPRTDGCAIGY